VRRPTAAYERGKITALWRWAGTRGAIEGEADSSKTSSLRNSIRAKAEYRQAAAGTTLQRHVWSCQAFFSPLFCDRQRWKKSIDSSQNKTNRAHSIPNRNSARSQHGFWAQSARKVSHHHRATGFRNLPRNAVPRKIPRSRTAVSGCRRLPICQHKRVLKLFIGVGNSFWRTRLANASFCAITSDCSSPIRAPGSPVFDDSPNTRRLCWPSAKSKTQSDRGTRRRNNRQTRTLRKPCVFHVPISDYASLLLHSLKHDTADSR